MESELEDLIAQADTEADLKLKAEKKLSVTGRLWYRLRWPRCVFALLTRGPCWSRRALARADGYMRVQRGARACYLMGAPTHTLGRVLMYA